MFLLGPRRLTVRTLPSQGSNSGSIPDGVTRQNMIFNQFINDAFPYIAGAIIGVVGSFGSGFVREFFDERARKLKHRRNVARQVLKICNEASTGNFLARPRDQEHIESVLTDVGGIDRNITITMNSFIKLWERTSLEAQNTTQYAETLRDIKEKRQQLIHWANKIRVGDDAE